MSQHKATVAWHLPAAGKIAGADFLKGKYSRAHTWSFDGGAVVEASSSPGVVPVPMSNAANVDPEEAFVAALSSCHMLTYLYAAARKGFIVERYRDEAVGVLAKNEQGVFWVKTVTLHPRIAYIGGAPSPAEEDELHHQAHAQCFIANSVKTDVIVGKA